jgi:hypothetical protein
VIGGTAVTEIDVERREETMIFWHSRGNVTFEKSVVGALKEPAEGK